MSPNKDVNAITLDLFEAEKYREAVIIQQLIGNLVYYSNHGQYEPRLAESWSRTNDKTWEFKLKQGFKCENGELINPESFKHSLERNIKSLGLKSNLPVFDKLIGYESFLSGEQNLEGISTNDQSIIFKFIQPIRSGIVQILSFAPFGYISKENLNPDGSWKDNKKFISSGAYKVKELTIGSKYVLEKRTDWTLDLEKSPKIVQIIHELPSENSENLE